MANYNRTSDRFEVKDNLPPGTAAKVILGAEIDQELNDAASAINSKIDPTDVGAVDGVCGLDANQLVDPDNLPTASTTVKGAREVATATEVGTGTADRMLGAAETKTHFEAGLAWNIILSGSLTANGAIDLSGAPSMALPSNATLGGGQVWSAANDGAGTGLDADLLDGQQGSYYLDPANLSTTVPVAKQDPNTAYLNVTQGFEKGQYVDKVDVVNASGVYVIDCREGNVFEIALSASGSTSLQQMQDGQQIVLVVKQGGSFTLTIAGVEWAYGAAPVITTGSGSVDVITLTKTGAGEIYGTYAQDFS